MILRLGKKTIVKFSGLFCLVLVLVITPVGCKKQEPKTQQAPQQVVEDVQEPNEEPVVQKARVKRTIAAKPAVSEPEKPAPEPYQRPVATVSTKPPELKATAVSGDPVEALTRAVAQGDMDQVQTLIKQGADVNADIKGGVTFLHIALLQGHEEVAALLIAGGADTRAKMMDGTTPLHLAAMRDCRLVAAFLLDDGADVNATGGQGTPLHLAATAGHKEMAALLISKGADLAAKNQAGQTPLEVAKQKGHSGLYELLGEQTAEQ